MKRIISLFCILAIMCTFLASCSAAADLNKKGNDYADTVMNNLSNWETADGKYCAILQLYELDGQYYLYCGYNETAAEHNNEAVNRYAASVSYRYIVTDTTFGGGEKTSMPNPMEALNGQKNLLGTSIYYYNDTYEEKYELIDSLFEKIN